MTLDCINCPEWISNTLGHTLSVALMWMLPVCPFLLCLTRFHTTGEAVTGFNLATGEQHKRLISPCHPLTCTLKKLLKFLLELSDLRVFQEGSGKSIMDVTSTLLLVNIGPAFLGCFLSSCSFCSAPK